MLSCLIQKVEDLFCAETDDLALFNSQFDAQKIKPMFDKLRIELKRVRVPVEQIVAKATSHPIVVALQKVFDNAGTAMDKCNAQVNQSAIVKLLNHENIQSAAKGKILRDGVSKMMKVCKEHAVDQYLFPCVKTAVEALMAVDPTPSDTSVVVDGAPPTTPAGKKRKVSSMS